MNTSRSNTHGPGRIEMILIYIAVIVTLALIATLLESGGLFF